MFSLKSLPGFAALTLLFAPSLTHAQVRIPANARLGPTIASPAGSGLCGSYADFDPTVPYLYEPSGIDEIACRNADAGPTLPSMSVVTRGFDCMRVFDNQNTRELPQPAFYPGGAFWAATSPAIPTQGYAIFRGYLNIAGTAGAPVTRTVGVFCADGQRTLIGGVVVSQGPYFQGQRYRAVTFPEPGVYPFEVQWSTNHATSFPPYEGLEVVMADGVVEGYAELDIDYFSPVPAPGSFALLTAPTLIPTLTGASTAAPITDLDGDSIPDTSEGIGCRVLESRDTDDDGVPDYVDLDSDGDTVPDRNEAGADPVRPVDTDRDGEPDFIDTDSDNDCIPDRMESDAMARVTVGPAPDRACSGATPFCDTTRGRCVACNGTPSPDVRCRAAFPDRPVCLTTGPRVGSCVACLTSSQCASTAPFCTADNTCVGCHLAPMPDALCNTATTGMLPVCITSGTRQGQCARCTEDRHCSGATSRCDSSTFTCVGCVNNSQCSGATPFCDDVSRRCRGCDPMRSSDCPDPMRPACALTGPSAGQCVACTLTMTSACPMERPACDASNNQCVVCTAGVGGDAQRCRGAMEGVLCVSGPSGAASNFCGCRADMDCGDGFSGRVCDPSTQRCINGCRTPGEGRNGCPRGLFCTTIVPSELGQCSTTCVRDMDCTVPRFACVPAMGMMMSFCAECARDSHCAGRRDGRDRCIGANNTCAQCTDSDRGVCTATGTGSQCVSGLCGCTRDEHCSVGRRCNLSDSRCEEAPDAGPFMDVREDVQDVSVPADVPAPEDVRIPMDGRPTPVAYVGGGCGCRVGAEQTSRGGRCLVMLGVAMVFATRRRRNNSSVG
jgi:MYXO-CTERM domain-containing protein